MLRAIAQNESVDLDQRNLQFLFNVISITGITSFAPICYLLKRDNRELMTKRNPPRELDERALMSPSPSPIQREPAPQPELSLDIREFVRDRAHGWVAPSPSQWNRAPDRGITVP